MAELIINTGAVLNNYRHYTAGGQVIPVLKSHGYGMGAQQLRGLRGAAAGGDHPDVFPPRRALAARHGGVSDAPAADAGKAHGRIAPTGSSGRETERYRLLFMPAAVTIK